MSDNLFAERPLMGWPATWVRMFSYDPVFRVILIAGERSETLYEGNSFKDASLAYLHPFVYHPEQTDMFTTPTFAEV